MINPVTAAAATMRQAHSSNRWFLYSDVISFTDEAKEFAELSNKVEAALTCVRDSSSFDCNSLTKSETFLEASSDSKKIFSSSPKIESSSLEFGGDSGVPASGRAGEGEPDGACADSGTSNKQSKTESHSPLHIIPP